MFEVVGFYKFVKISYLKKNQKVLLETLKKKNIRGTIIISKEGVNGTISGKALPEIVPFTPSLEIIIVPLMFFFFKVSNKTF